MEGKGKTREGNIQSNEKDIGNYKGTISYDVNEIKLNGEPNRSRVYFHWRGIEEWTRY